MSAERAPADAAEKDELVSYVGSFATVTGTLSVGCQTAACGIDPNSLQVDVHLVVGARRVGSVRTGPGAAPRTIYLHRDRLGSVVATTLGGGLMGASYRYSAYGAVDIASGDSGDAASELGYAGAPRISGGLLVMGVRVYHPAMRVFMQPDPLDPNTYSYVAGDPINLTDPSGMDNCPPTGCEEYILVVGKRLPQPEPDPRYDFTAAASSGGGGSLAGHGGLANGQVPGPRPGRDRQGPTWVSEFNRNFLSNGKVLYQWGTSLPGEASRFILDVVLANLIAQEVNQVTFLQAVRLTLSMLADVNWLVAFPEGSDILGAAIWESAAGTMLMTAWVSTTGLAVGISLGLAADASVDATYTVVVDPIYVVLSHGRY